MPYPVTALHLRACILSNGTPLQAETHLTTAWQLCHKDAHRNKEYVSCRGQPNQAPSVKHLHVPPRLILTYLIPTRLLTTHSLPSKTLLEPYPQLARLFTPISAAIRRGDLAGFDAALVESEEALVRRRIYLTLERSRDVALRNLLRRVFLAGGWVEEPAAGGDGGVVRVRRTRIPVKEFVAAVTLSSAGGLSPGDVQASRVASAPVMDQDEVECMLANMIYKVSAGEFL